LKDTTISPSSLGLLSCARASAAGINAIASESAVTGQPSLAVLTLMFASTRKALPEKSFLL
jgi:hypothetical protein